MLEELRRRINKDYFYSENIEFFNKMKDTYGKREYKCKCGSNEEQFVWESELTNYTFKCNKCNKELDIKNLKTKEVPQTAAIRTPTKNR